MKYHRRHFRSVLVVANPQGKPWFARSCWSRLAPAFEAMVAAFRPLGVPELRCDHWDEHGKAVKLGRLRWDAGDWTIPDAQLSKRHFNAMELWLPGAATCTKRDAAPDLFVHLHAYRMHELSFSQALLVACAKDAAVTDAEPLIERFVQAAVSASAVEFVARRRGPWAHGTGQSFSDGLGVLLVTGLTDRVARPYKASQIRERAWQLDG